MKDEINVNLSSCLVKQYNIGSYEYINICTGEINKIDWDFIDWTSLVLITIFMILVIGVIGIFIKELIRK